MRSRCAWGFVVCLLAAGCVTGERARALPPLASEAALVGDEPSEEPRWSRAWEPGVGEVWVYAESDCVFLDGLRGEGAGLERVLGCVDPRSSETRWTASAPVSGRSREGGLRLVQGRALWQEGDALLAWDRATGARAWTYQDGEGGRLFGVFTAGERIWVNIDNRALRELDRERGGVLGELPLAGQTVSAVSLVGGEVEAVALELRGAEASLRGVKAEGAGWSTPIRKWTGAMEVVGGVLVGELEEGELWAVALEDGRVLWRRAAHTFGGRVLYGASGLVVAEAGVEAASDGDGEGKVLRLRGIDVREAGGARWELEVPTAYNALGIEAVEGGPRLFGATFDRFVLVDETTGALVWSYHISHLARPGLWSTASCNSGAVFVYFEGSPAQPGVLQRIPIVPE